MKNLARLFFAFALLSGILLFSSRAHAQAQESLIIGCCQMVKINGATEIQDLNKEACEKPDEAHYKSKVWHRDKRRLGSKCEAKPNLESRKLGDAVIYTPAVTLPGSKYVAGTEIKIADNTAALAEYIVAFFKFSIGIITIISVIVMMIAGILWLTSAGNSEQVASARKLIISSLLGSVLSACSFILLSTINTNLVDLRVTTVKKIDNLDMAGQGCCWKPDGQTAVTSLDTECTTEKQGQKAIFMKGHEAIANKCEPIKGCCQVAERITKVNLRAFNVEIPQDCKSSGLAGAVSEIAATFTFKRGFVTQDNVQCNEGSNTAQQETGCINTNQAGCQTSANCCSGLKCSMGGEPSTTICESCISLWRYGCQGNADCCQAPGSPARICQYDQYGPKCIEANP